MVLRIPFKIDRATLITFALFSTEAIMHYNIGHNTHREKFKFTLPNYKDLIKILSVVMLISIINRCLTKRFT